MAWNLDYLCNMKFGKHPFIKTLHNLNLFQLVKVITRPLSKACLDHIWSSHPERRINVQVFPSGLSDHLPTIATRKNKPAVQSTVVLQQSPTVTSTTRIKNSLLLLWKKCLGIARLFSMTPMTLSTPGMKYLMVLLTIFFLLKTSEWKGKLSPNGLMTTS